MKISKELKIGVSALVILALAYWGISFLKGKNLFKAQVSYVAVYDDLTDMKTSAPVFYRGMKIGSVTALNMSSLYSDASVTLTISKKYKLPDNSVAVMRNASLMGGKSIDIVLGDSKTMLNNGDTIRTAVQGDLVTNQLNTLATGATNLMDTLERTLVRINGLLSAENVRNISDAISDLAAISGNLNEAVASEKRQIADVVDNLADVSSGLKNSMPALNAAMNNIDTLSSGLKGSLPQTIARLDSLLAAVNDREGSAGKLLHDGAVYDNLNQALENLHVLLADLKEHPERYVQFSVFGKKSKK